MQRRRNFTRACTRCGVVRDCHGFASAASKICRVCRPQGNPLTITQATRCDTCHTFRHPASFTDSATTCCACLNLSRI